MNSDFLKDLNQEQKKAVLQTDGQIIILAGAGSGKTLEKFAGNFR